MPGLSPRPQSPQEKERGKSLPRMVGEQVNLWCILKTRRWHAALQKARLLLVCRRIYGLSHQVSTASEGTASQISSRIVPLSPGSDNAHFQAALSFFRDRFSWHLAFPHCHPPSLSCSHLFSSSFISHTRTEDIPVWKGDLSPFPSSSSRHDFHRQTKAICNSGKATKPRKQRKMI